jgi:ATP-dependent DNA ligase
MSAVGERGEEFYRVVCERDLEGIVAKPKHGLYYSDGLCTNWLKIKNPATRK